MRKAAIVVNYRKQACLDLAEELAGYLRLHEVEVLSSQSGDVFTVHDILTTDFSGTDMAFVLGGDGTMLAAGRAMAPYGVPVLGVNMGRVGFLAELEPKELLPAVRLLLDGNFAIEERMMLHCVMLREGKQIDSCHAFNDVVINNGVYARTVELDLRIDGQFIHSYQADGIIIATPTGSTGYSFSAGGPIVLPSMDVIVIVPICPHTFFSRPIVASPGSVVEVSCRNFSDATTFSTDGQYRANIQIDDLLRVSLSKHKVKMVCLGASTPFARLKNKVYQT